MFKVLNGLLGQEMPKLPQYTNEKNLAENFNNFFVDKIRHVCKQLENKTKLLISYRGHNRVNQYFKHFKLIYAYVYMNIYIQKYTYTLYINHV